MIQKKVKAGYVWTETGCLVQAGGGVWAIRENRSWGISGASISESTVHGSRRDATTDMQQ